METQIQNNASTGKFIAFEGIDGSGKSTQMQLLLQKLRDQKINYYETREPTDSPIGSIIHRLDHLLNNIDGIFEKINAGTTVISDRYYFSSYAYHSVDMDMDWVIQANSICADLLKPTCTVFIDTDPDEAMRRISSGRSKSELFETRERLILVREKYLEAINRQREIENVIIVNGNNDFRQVADEIWQKLRGYFID